ncbi:ornithine cyclodeaminase [Novosphingobium sp. PhB165]|uniref:ornithine cyclodeaminase family protein n=1 Tax=Novosphingobium sp. PhB165 TaxID=2485105 RepID=UPI001052368C|nr:ornithine cyclodeaminase family protein [Novosphingobium sp. PhB165]TCM15424.1 ornithine cyclodeaminase [Novosphingobium sp. PhB165]
MRLIDAAEVAQRLDHRTGIALVREAMIALSTGGSKQLLRGIIDLDEGNAFGVMPGALTGSGFGAKIVSVFPGAAAQGRSHQGVIVTFDPVTGAPAAVVDAGEVTAIRTGCATAVATDALARADAKRLAILGTGEQAWHHAAALRHVRPFEAVSIWGRDPAKARAMATRIERDFGLATRAASSVDEAVKDADVICAVSAAAEPILLSEQVADGVHINAVGSSRAGPVEIDPALVRRARFIPDHRVGVLAQGAEYLRAVELGLAAEDDVGPEIGRILAGLDAGRESASQVTVYKSLGSIVQDLACAAFLAH